MLLTAPPWLLPVGRWLGAGLPPAVRSGHSSCHHQGRSVEGAVSLHSLWPPFSSRIRVHTKTTREDMFPRFVVNTT